MRQEPSTVTQRGGLWTALAACGLALALTLTLPGCLGSSNSSRPVLSVDLMWDDNTSPTAFNAGSCQSAGVANVVWTLTKVGEKTPAKASPSGGESCENGFDFFDLPPGTYDLTITGYDSSDTDVWKTTKCTGLRIEAFDDAFRCDMLQ